MAVDLECLRRKAMDLLALEIAEDDMGVYPQAVSGGPKPYEKRTEWMEGWNAYGRVLVEKESAIRHWLEKLSDGHKAEIENHLLSDNLSLAVCDGECKLWVNCSDLFYWACADAEDFTIEDLPEFNRALAESPEHGTLLWCCRKCGMRPQRPYYKYFSDEEKTLFDATGPERNE